MLSALTATELNIRILLSLLVVIAAARLVGWGISKVGQPRVHGEILAGIILGPSLVGLLLFGCLAVARARHALGMHLALAVALLGALGALPNVARIGQLFDGTAERPYGKNQRIQFLVIPKLREIESDGSRFGPRTGFDSIHQPTGAVPQSVRGPSSSCRRRSPARSAEPCSCTTRSRRISSPSSMGRIRFA